MYVHSHLRIQIHVLVRTDVKSPPTPAAYAHARAHQTTAAHAHARAHQTLAAHAHARAHQTEYFAPEALSQWLSVRDNDGKTALEVRHPYRLFLS